MPSKSKAATRKRPYKIEDFYTPFTRQKEFHDSDAKYRLFGGAAGPGKTKALLYEAIYQAHKHPGVDTLLLRRTFPELEASLITYFRRDVPRELYEKYNEAKHIVTWLNGSTTRFAYYDSETDVYRYQGAEYLFIGIDELTHFTLKQWQFLTSRNRCRIKGAKPCMAGATNPGNIGHTANVEDVLKCDGDDPSDAARYGLKSALDPGRAPAEVVAAERVTAVDPTSRAIWLKKFSAEESRRISPVMPRRWRPQGW